MLDGKTLYEERHKKKSNLTGLQEFGVATYVKDLNVGKLESRAQIECFFGYNSESKGYRIYWLDKHSITVEQSVVFNKSNVCSNNTTAIIPGDALAEGKRNKVIQSPHVQHTKEGSAQNDLPTLLATPSPISIQTDMIPPDKPLPEQLDNKDKPMELGCRH